MDRSKREGVCVAFTRIDYSIERVCTRLASRRSIGKVNETIYMPFTMDNTRVDGERRGIGSSARRKIKREGLLAARKRFKTCRSINSSFLRYSRVPYQAELTSLFIKKKKKKIRRQ